MGISTRTQRAWRIRTWNLEKRSKRRDWNTIPRNHVIYRYHTIFLYEIEWYKIS